MQSNPESINNSTEAAIRMIAEINRKIFGDNVVIVDETHSTQKKLDTENNEIPV